MTSDRHRQLRSAVYRGDGAEIVAILAAAPFDIDQLQVIGDALSVALDVGADGAGRLASTCAAQLRERDEVGDELLAEHLDELMGRPPTSSQLHSLPVRLEELSEALEGDPMYGGGRIDRQTGEVWHQSQIDYAVEIGEEDAEDHDPERWLSIDCEGSRPGYRDMVAFIETVDDARIADRLARAIEGKGAFRRFKDTLSEWDELFTRWHRFSDDRRIGRAREWLADAGYRPADARPADAGSAES